MDAQFWAALAGIVWLDLLLSGDNALVIAMVCGGLEPRRRAIGMWLGTGGAIVLRIVLAFCVAWLMAWPGLMAVGGAFLLYVAAGLVMGGGDAEARAPSRTLIGAVATIAAADVSMSLDNVMAIAALSRGDWVLMAAGVLISIPMIVAGAAVISKVLERLPALAWAGAGLLGYVAGGIISADPLVSGYLRADPDALHHALGGIGCAAVLAVGLAVRRARADEPSPAVAAA